jgi:hypothetical protein
MRHTNALLCAVVLVLGALPACTQARSYCQKEAQCLDEERDIQLEDDSVGVCAAEYEGQIAALRANEEPECRILAQAILDFDACRASLDCNDFFDDNNIEDECGDQLDALNDAFDDVSGDECLAQES